MSKILECLKKIVIFSLDVNGALSALKDLADRGILSPSEMYEDLLKRVGVDKGLLNSVIDRLLSYGILRRKSVHEFEIVDKEQVLEAINSLEGFLSDKVVVPDGYKVSFWRHGEKVTARIFFFARSGTRIFRMRRLAVDSLIGDLAEYLVVPRSSLNDLILTVEVEEDYVRFYWIDPEVLSSLRIFLDSFVSQGVQFPKEKSCMIKANELLSYTFDVEENDLIEVDLSKMLNSEVKKVKMLADKIFSIKGDVDEHDEICSLLAEVGKVKGYEVSLEHKIVGDLRLDVAYIKNGAITAAFEVVLMGSLKEALFKLGLVNARAKFLVAGRDKSSKVQKILPQNIRTIEAETVAEAKRSVTALATLLDEIGKTLNESSASGSAKGNAEAV